MSSPAEPESPRPGGPGNGNGNAPDPKQVESAADETQQSGDAAEEHDQPQNAWSARRDLVDHSPRSMNVGDRSRFGGSLVGRDQHGVSGGRVAGDVIMGSKTEIHYAIPGISAPSSASGEVPRTTLDRLATTFVADEEVMAGLLDRLRRDRVLVLSGARFTGRRTAALMLLHRLAAAPVRTLVRDTSPSSLAERFTAEDQARGYVLCDLATRRDRPLREPHLLAAKDRLAEQDAYLVVTVGPTAVLEDVPAVEWRPPATADVLAAHLRTRTDAETAAKLLGLPDVVEFLDRGHQLREVAAFAQLLGDYATGKVTEDAVAQFSLASLENQVQEWFEEDESAVHLRDKAFLVALAAFDGGPYALTAELSDLLYRFLQETENPARVPEVPVFGTHIGKRLQLARAERFEDDEHTEWGPVTQQKARFLDERASLVLLRELWTGHPSARPALIHWLRRLADDGRPLVRTRAASTVAILARTDLPSAMALVIEPWATSKRFRQRLVAVNALTLAHLIDTPNIPRILDAWCEGGDARLRWVAVRSYGLIGPERPEQALAALRKAVRRLYDDGPDDLDEAMAGELAEAVELLLLSSASEKVLAELREHLDDDRAVHDLTLAGFVNACLRKEDDERYGTPLVLAWYARAVPAGGAAAHGIPYLWRAALADPRATRHALDVLREWVLIADRSTATEWALAALLPDLVTTPAEHQRLSHLLRTMPGEDGNPPPLVAARLLTTLPTR
ncbi:hypothetical protein [Streptomyces sp. NPDC002088]|uniref:hypothetical protein n=1 Tax=Streptomyces sp. NPDC002088 TaxID=3154665 RepID=UPI00332767B1